MDLLAIIGLLVLLAKPSLEELSNYDEKVSLLFPMRHKREVASSKAKKDDVYALANQFIQDKLAEHGQALETLVALMQKNEELTKRLVEKLSNSQRDEVPELPEKVELPGRRSFEVYTPEIRGERGNPWCIAAYLCRKPGVKVCGFDSGYGYGRFKDICHMFDVNCYWEYNFLLSSACDRIF